MTTETEQPTIPVPAETAPSALYRFSTWVHAGAGAEECSEVDEEAGTSHCGDSGHFHAWCRLPNPLQEREIRERAQAAKARRIRQLRDAETDVNLIIETELESLRAEPDFDERAATELVGQDWAEDYLAAVRVVRDRDDEGEGAEEDAKLYAHIEDDQARFNRLLAVPEDERAKDEFEELQRHLMAYQDAVREQFEAITNPKKETYQQMPEDELFDLIRRKRIERSGTEEYLHTYGVQEWLSCAYKERGGEHYFTDLAQLEGASGEVLAALEETFTDLERTARAAQGN